MKKEYKWLFNGLIAILVIDAIGSVCSRSFNFNYTYIWPASLFIYAVFGYIVTKVAGLRTGILLTTILGFFDATLGWKVSMLLHANTGTVNNEPNLQRWVITIIFVMIYGAVIGLISGVIALKIKKTDHLS